MTTASLANSVQPRRCWKVFVLCLIVSGMIGQIGCTREDVAGAIATLAVDLRATIEPLGATAEANANALETRLPIAFALDRSAVVSAIDSPEISAPTQSSPESEPPPTVTATATPSATATSSPTEEPPPSPTAEPTLAPTTTVTAIPSPTPIPLEISVDGGRMIFVAGGFFEMGTTAESLLEECDRFREGCEEDWFKASGPPHMVLIAPYYIDVHEVTNEIYATFLNSIGNHESSCVDQDCLSLEESQITLEDGVYTIADELALYPAAGVTWYGANAFCEWREGRLPTEAEWEKAAGWDDATVAKSRYPWGDEFVGNVVNFCDSNCDAPQANNDYDDGYAAAAPVASYESGRSPSGAYDMAGNVWEWVLDWYAPDFFTEAIYTNPIGPDSGNDKVVRGGSWFDSGNFAATTIRFPSPPDNADKTIGFRCASGLPGR